MKIARILIAMLATFAFASLCAAQCGPAKPKAAGAGSLDAMIAAQEQQIIDAIKKKDAAAFKSLVDTEGGMEVTPQGVRKISDTMVELFSADLTFSDLSMSEPSVKMIDKNTVVLTYKSMGTATYKGKTMSGTSFDTTIYSRRGAKWVAIFHQSTDMEKPAEGAMGAK